MKTSLFGVRATQKISTHGQSGQIALIVLLLMAVVLTVGLSIASRTVMDVSLSRQEEEGSMTFQAAESGIENALNQDFASINSEQTLYLGTIGGANVTAVITPQNTIETRVEQGGSVQVTTSLGGTVEPPKSLIIRFGTTGTCPQLLIRIYNQNGTAYSARNYGVSACTANPAGTSFTSTGVSLVATGGFTYSQLLSIHDKVVSIQVLGADAPISVTSSGFVLPTQYFSIHSRATNLSGTEQRAIVVTRTAAGHPGILDYALYSGSTISK